MEDGGMRCARQVAEMSSKCMHKIMCENVPRPPSEQVRLVRSN